MDVRAGKPERGEGTEMNTTWQRAIVAGIVAIIFFGPAALEILSQRVRVDELSTTGLTSRHEYPDRSQLPIGLIRVAARDER